MSGTTKIVPQADEDKPIYDPRLPHEWLRDLALGNPVRQRRVEIVRNDRGEIVDRVCFEELSYPTLKTRIRCATAAAPFFAPRLSSARVESSSPEALAEALRDLSRSLPG